MTEKKQGPEGESRAKSSVKDDFIAPILVLSLICLVISGALALMNGVTHPMIEAAAAERTQLAMREVIPHATGFELIHDDELARTIRQAYRTQNDVGYVFVVGVKGFSGEIRIIVGIDPNGKLITSSTLSHTETKGIGNILDELSWTGQFDGKDSSLAGISTVTGATISTSAYMNGIREAFAAFETVRAR